MAQVIQGEQDPHADQSCPPWGKSGFREVAWDTQTPFTMVLVLQSCGRR